MKKLTVLLASLVVVSSFSVANAFEVGVDAKVGKFKSKTTYTGPGYSEEIKFDGTLGQVELSVGHNFSGFVPKLILGLSKSLSADGERTYSVNTPTEWKEVELTGYKLEGRLGYEVKAGTAAITPYLGVGTERMKYEYEFHGSVLKVYFSDKVKANFWRVGLAYNQKISEGLGLYADLSMLRPFKSEIDSDYSDTDGETDSDSAKYDKKFSYEAEIGMTFAKYFKAGLFYEYKKLGEAKDKSDGEKWSDSTKFTNFGVKVGVSF